MGLGFAYRIVVELVHRLQFDTGADQSRNVYWKLSDFPSSCSILSQVQLPRFKSCMSLGGRDTYKSWELLRWKFPRPGLCPRLQGRYLSAVLLTNQPILCSEFYLTFRTGFSSPISLSLSRMASVSLTSPWGHPPSSVNMLAVDVFIYVSSSTPCLWILLTWIR